MSFGDKITLIYNKDTLDKNILLFVDGYSRPRSIKVSHLRSETLKCWKDHALGY